MSAELLNLLRDVFWKAINEPELKAWGDKSGIPIILSANGVDTEKNIKQIIADFAKIRPTIKEAMAKK